MAQAVLTVVGNAFGPLGAIAGSMIGGAIDQALFGPKNKAPKVGDLSAPKLEYGSEIPRLAGTCVTAGSLGWMSEKRATEVEAGGKGGGSQVVGYTYSADCIFILGQHDQETIWQAVALPRAWRNGELVYSKRAGADPQTYEASDGTTAWDSIELLDGNLTQLPPDVYETAVTTLLAKGWRGQNCVLLRNARFGSSTLPPAYKFEVITAGTPSTVETNDPPEVVGSTQGTGTSPTPVTGVEAGDAVVLCIHMVSGTPTMDTAAYTLIESAQTSSGGSKLWVFGRTADGTAADDELSFTVGGGATVGYWGVIAVRSEADALFLDPTSTNVTLDGNPSAGGITKASGTYQFAIAGCWIDNTGDATLVAPPAGYTQYAYGAWDWVSGVDPIDSELMLAYKIVTGLSENPGDFDDGPGGYGGGGYGALTFVFTAAMATAHTVHEPGTIDLADLVEAHCRRANIPAALLDVTDLVGIPVRGFASYGGVRAALEQLAKVFHFGAVCDDKLRFILHGGASAASITYADLGAGFDQPAKEALEENFGNDDEVPRKRGLTYININADHDAGSVIGDRGTGNLQRIVTDEVGVVMTPTEALRVADGLALDVRYAATTFKGPTSEYHAERQPTDVVTLTNRIGISYRARITAENWSLGVHDYEYALDDASVWSQDGVATDDTTPTIDIPLPAEPELLLLDIPILRDVDDGYGLYACVTGEGTFKGCSVRRSRDGGTTYSEVGTLKNKAIAGTVTALGASTTWGWDDVSTMTLTLSAGAGGVPTTATKAAVEADATLNLAAVGAHGRWEIVRFTNSALIAADTYLFSGGMLRGQFGTEHNRANHVAGDTFVLLRETGMIRIVGDATDVGVERNFKAVPNLGSEAAVDAVAFTTGEQGLKCYAPVDLRIDGTDLTFNRRTRYATPNIDGIQPPLGEAIEQYDIELYSGATLVEGPVTVSASPYTPVTTLAGKTAKVWQRNSSIGRGHEAEKAL
jgi:hypothetical protein